MKHLKKFENYNTESNEDYHKNMIIDLFQEYIYDYDIEFADILHHNSRDKKREGDQSIFYWIRINTVASPISLRDLGAFLTLVIFGEKTYKYQLLINDLEENFIPRLENIGYTCEKSDNEVEWPERYGTEKFTTILTFINIMCP